MHSMPFCFWASWTTGSSKMVSIESAEQFNASIRKIEGILAECRPSPVFCAYDILSSIV